MTTTQTAPRQSSGNQSKNGGRTPPHNLDAEEALLGAALSTTAAMETAATEVESDDFYEPAHGTIHATIRKLWEAGVMTPDTVLVADELAADGTLEEVGGVARLLAIKAMVPHVGNAREYARIVVEMATLRRLISTAAEVAYMAYDLPENVAETCDMARHMISTVDLPVNTGNMSPDATAFTDLEDAHDWLVPGLLERRDRIIVTGGEGGGKSTLLRQLAVMLAAGLHPFQFHTIKPVRVLIVDAENSAPQIGRALNPLLELAAKQPGWDPGNLRLEVRTDGMDLAHRHDSRWLLERIATNRPDILITGPLYKLHADDPNDEMMARKVVRVLDIARSRYDCAIVLEAHSPHGGKDGRRSLRPFGSSLWLRWPEFGYGLRPCDDGPSRPDGRPGDAWWSSWRGPRDTRDWPEKLTADGRELWPWRDAYKRATPALTPQPQTLI